MNFPKYHNNVNYTTNTSIEQSCNLEKELNTKATPTSCPAHTNSSKPAKSAKSAAATDEVNMLTTNCTSCNSKGVNFYLAVNNSQKAKLLRALIILLATICTAYVCALSSRRYFYTWVQTVIESTDVHVSEISFPAVTICPVKGLNLARLETEAMAFTTLSTKSSSASSSITSKLRTDKDLQEFYLLLNSLNDLMWSSMPDTIETTNQYNNESVKIEQFLEDLAAKGNANAFETINLNELIYFLSFECEDIFAECTWRRTRVSCCTIFHRIHTLRGVCYAFNSLRVEDPVPSWPWVVSNAGLQTGLRVLIKRSTIGNYYERVATMVHDPEETSATDINYLTGERVMITVNPLRFTADSDIHAVSPDFRHCYFTSELKLGKSRGNCMRTCRVKYIERNCNCTYIFPVATKSLLKGNFPICQASNLRCIYKHRYALKSSGNILEEYIDDVAFNTYNCKCYPNCNYIQYGTMVNTDITGETRSKDFIDLQVQYQHETLFSYRSTLCFNILDLLVSYGGIAGLFLGLSLVGIIELLHDFIVFCKKRTQKPLITTENKK